MLVTKTISRNKTHVRCGTPDCDWGTPLTSFGKSELRRFGGPEADAACLSAR
jgi:hypothetical protein